MIKKFLLALSLLGILVSPALAQEALTLRDCYELALKRSETIAVDREIIKEYEAEFLQSFSGILPQVDYEIAQTRQDEDHGSNPHGNRYRRFTFSQPLFSGFKEFAAMAGAKALRREGEDQLERAKQLLFTDVSDAFYFFQSYEETFQVFQNIHQALTDRLTELKRRQSKGRSRDSEIASAEASFYKTEADLETVRSQLEVARQLLEFLIGQPFTSLQDTPLAVDTSISEVEVFLNKVDERPDVKAAIEAVKVARKNITIARSGFWPAVSLEGNSYDQRTGTSSNIDWDVTFKVVVPVFHGTETLGEVRQAQARAREAELFLSQTKRNAILNIRNAYSQFVLNYKIELALNRSVEAAQKNYDLQKADYTRTLVNNLDVLQALQDLEDAQRTYVDSKNQTKRFYWNLKVATGDISHDAF